MDFQKGTLIRKNKDHTPQVPHFASPAQLTTVLATSMSPFRASGISDTTEEYDFKAAMNSCD
jgi:hypothetical protein